MKLVYIFLLILGVSACALKPKMELNGDIIQISTSELNNYWVPKNKQFSFDLRNYRKGYVKFRYTIDSNGNLFNPEVVESKPEGLVDKAGLLALAEMKYIAASSNKNRTPVQVITEIRFE